MSTRLAFERTAMAADRSLMAWIRTALALIAFGFTIVRLLASFEPERPSGTPIGLLTPREVGTFLIALGIASVIIGLTEYRNIARRLHAQSGLRVSWMVAVVAFCVGVLGAILFADLVFGVGTP